MNKSKLFFILTAAVLLISTACSGTFEDPGSGGSSNPFIGAGGGGGPNPNPGPSTPTDTGSIKIVNNSGYKIIGGTINQNGKAVKSFPSMNIGASVTYSAIPVGGCDILVSRDAGLGSIQRWSSPTIYVTKNNTSTVSITKSGWK